MRITKEEMEKAMIYFEIRQWSAKEKLLESKLASILPICSNQGHFLQNKRYDLSIFKSKSPLIDIASFLKNDCLFFVLLF